MERDRVASYATKYAGDNGQSVRLKRWIFGPGLELVIHERNPTPNRKMMQENLQPVIFLRPCYFLV
jgi:hypothetical protein